MADKYKSVVIYGSWLKTARDLLQEDEVCKLMVQLIEYGLNETEPEHDNDVMKAIFMMAKPNIDSNVQKRENGKKGGRGNKKTSGLSNVNVNGNANANANDNDNGNDNDNAVRRSADASALDAAEDAASGAEGIEWKNA